MASKLAYLSKYGAGGGDIDCVDDRADESRRKSKKKDKKKKGGSRRDYDDDYDDDEGRGREREKNDGTTVVRDMDDIRAYLPGDGDGRDDDEDVLVIPAADLGVAADHLLAVAISSSAAAAGRRGGAGRGFVSVSVPNDDDDVERRPRRRRHDSDSSDGEAAVAVASSPAGRKRRDRHDSDSNDDDDNDHNDANRGGMNRGGDDDGARDPRETFTHDRDSGKEGGSKIRDVDRDDVGVGGLDVEGGRRGRRLLERHDSDSSDDEERGRTRREDKKRRKGHDFDSDSGDGGSDRRKRRHDSDSHPEDDDVEDRRGGRNGERRRHDSSSDLDSKSDGSPSGGRRKEAIMSSGHRAGLQRSRDFAIAEREIREKRREEMRQFNAVGEGGGGRPNRVERTVYRDASGKKRNVSSKDDYEGHSRRSEEDKSERQRLANRGTHQRLLEEARARKLEEASGMTLARGVDDARLEDRKRAVIREGDPMAMHALRRQQEKEATMMQSNQRTSGTNGGVATSQRQRPVYKGPQPKPNRYGLRPGYRWDGIDRGNGFEDRVLEALHSKGRKREEAYKWSAADM